VETLEVQGDTVEFLFPALFIVKTVYCVPQQSYITSAFVKGHAFFFFFHNHVLIDYVCTVKPHTFFDIL
jgi:hypothetical protein